MKVDPASPHRWPSERGSFIVAMIFFIFLFLIVAAMGVDMGRYFYTVNQNQNIADGATLAAAQAFNQVRSLPDISRAKITDAALRHIDEQKGYTTDAYEISATFKAGDLLSDSFVDAQQADFLGDTYIRIGLNVKYYFEPYFLPRYAFGDEFFAIQSQAVAELHPIYWTSNLYDPVEPGPPVPSLLYSIYSKENIKPEDQDCFVVNGDLHANSGYAKVEQMTDGTSANDCTDPDGGTDHWGLDRDGDGTPGEGHFYLDGNMTIGDPNGGPDPDDDCGGQTPGPGCLVFEQVDGHVTGDLTAQDFIDNCFSTTPPCPSVDGNVNAYSDEVPQITPEIPEKSPLEAPGDYPGTVCTFEDTGDSTVEFTGAGDFVDDDGNDCSDGGTVYVKNGDNMEIQGMNPSTDGNFTFVADGYVNITNVNGDNGHFENDEFAFISLNKWIKMQSISGKLEMDATFYAPKEGDLTQTELCNPNQVGCVKIEDSNGDLTINGSIVAGTLAKIENQRRFRMNWEANTDVLPNSLRQWIRNNDIPDYWQVHLID